MLYYIIADISSVSDRDVSDIRKNIAHHFSDKSNLKRKDSVCCKAVLWHLLKERFGHDDFFVDCDENGKPFVDQKGIFFNMSHSGKKVLCVCGDDRVGCDIEQIKASNPKIAERYFCPDEQKKLKNNECINFYFTKLWTLKESVLKFTGLGMSGGLSTYDFSEFLEKESFDFCGYHFESFIFEDYSVSICSNKKRILQLNADIEDIIKSLKGENHEFNQVY